MGDRGLEKADSHNLSHLNNEMVREFFRNDSRLNAKKYVL